MQAPPGLEAPFKKTASSIACIVTQHASGQGQSHQALDIDVVKACMQSKLVSETEVYLPRPLVRNCEKA